MFFFVRGTLDEEGSSNGRACEISSTPATRKFKVDGVDDAGNDDGGDEASAVVDGVFMTGRLAGRSDDDYDTGPDDFNAKEDFAGRV